MSFDFYRLDNGVRVVLVPMEGVESVAVGVYAKTGSRYETNHNNGISHFLEHMVFKGTKKFPSHQQTSYLEGLGAIQNAWTDVGATAYWGKLPADRWKEGLEMVKELALYPLFPAKDLEIERGVILEEINRREDQPEEVAAELLQKTMFAPHPLGLTVLGEPEVIKRVRREDFGAYHRQQYVAGRLVVAVAGKILNVQRSILKAKIEEWFGRLPSQRGQDLDRYQEGQTHPQAAFRHKRQVHQAHMMVGFRGLGVADPRRFASALLTSYLGQGLSSRLFLQLREIRGLCYAVRADEDKMEDTGVWSVYIGTGLATLEEAITATTAELGRVKEGGITEEDLAKTKEKVRGPLLFSLENPLSQMEWYARQALDRPQEILTHQQVIDRLMQIDCKDVQKIAQDLFVKDKLNLAIVGPVPEKVQAKLLTLARV